MTNRLYKVICSGCGTERHFATKQHAASTGWRFPVGTVLCPFCSPWVDGPSRLLVDGPSRLADDGPNYEKDNHD